LSNATFRATLNGFADPDADELLEPYAERYFDVVAGIWRDWTSDMAQFFTENAYPSWKITPEAIAAAEAYIERTSPPAALRRLLTEARDDVARALRCRQRDAQAT
jgi:aminopeptidase N